MDIDNDGWAATRLPWDLLSLDQAETVTTLIPTPAHPATLASPRPALREGSCWLILLLVCTAQFMVSSTPPS
jgi:hypothetical protein